MTDPAATFARQAPGVDAARVRSRGEVVDVYRGELTGGSGTVRLVTPAPEITDDRVLAVFEQTAAEFEDHQARPGVATVHGRGTVPRPWLAVGPVDGESLATLAETEGPATVGTVLADLAEIAQDAVRNECEWLHFTPAGVRGVENGGETRGHLADWGVDPNCRLVAGDGRSPFLPPESGGEMSVDPGPELVYGLGAVAHDAYVGRPPDRTAVEGTAATLDGEDGTGQVGIPDRLRATLRTALAVDPGKRYDSPYAFKRALLFDADRGSIQGIASTTDAAPQATGRGSPETSATDSSAENDPADTSQRSSLPTSRRATLGILGAGVLGSAGIGMALSELSGDDDPGADLSTSDDPGAAGTFSGGDGSVPSEPTATEEPTETQRQSGERTGMVPDALFSFAFDDDRLEITYVGGDAIVAENLLIRGSGFSNSPRVRWSSLPDGGEKSLFSPGTSVSFDADADVVAQLVWDGSSSGRPIVIDQYAGPERPLDPTIGNWRSYQYDSRNSGYALGETGPERPVEVDWRTEVAGSVRASPTVLDGVVYLGSSAGIVYALDASDGSELWRFVTESPVWAAPTLYDGGVYVGTEGGAVYALDASDGTEQWNFEATLVVTPPVVTSVQNSGGMVYVVSERPETDRSRPTPFGVLYALDATDGSLHWQFEGVSPFSPPAVEPPRSVDTLGRKGVAYVRDDGRMYALNAVTGDEQWTYTADGRELTAPTIGIHGYREASTLFVGSDDGTLDAVATRDGTQRWNVAFDGSGLTVPSVVDIGGQPRDGMTTYVGTDEGTILAVDGINGSLEWQTATDSDRLSPLVIGGETIYVSTGVEFSSGVSAFDSNGGDRQWRFGIDEQRRLTSPSVVGDTVYVASGLPIHPKTRQEIHRSSVYAIRG